MTQKARALGMTRTTYMQCVRPARRRPEHHRARSGAARPRHPGSLPALLQIFLDRILRVPRRVDPRPQSPARLGRRRRRHQDRLHPRLRLQPSDLGASRRALHRRRRHGRPFRFRARRPYARPDRRAHQGSRAPPHRADDRRIPARTQCSLLRSPKRRWLRHRWLRHRWLGAWYRAARRRRMPIRCRPRQ